MYRLNGASSFTCFDVPQVPEDYSIGLIVGPSGSGKSLLLHEYGTERAHEWQPDKAIVSHFATPDEAINRLMAVGLNSIPSWVAALSRPVHRTTHGPRTSASSHTATSLRRGVSCPKDLARKDQWDRPSSGLTIGTEMTVRVRHTNT